MTSPEPPRGRRGPLRWVVIGVVALVVLVVLFTVVFPWLERAISDPTLGVARAPSLPGAVTPPGR